QQAKALNLQSCCKALYLIPGKRLYDHCHYALNNVPLALQTAIGIAHQHGTDFGEPYWYGKALRRLKPGHCAPNILAIYEELRAISLHSGESNITGINRHPFPYFLFIVQLWLFLL